MLRKIRAEAAEMTVITNRNNSRGSMNHQVLRRMWKY